ncbi:MAG: hypothetical protein WC455_09660 [Dehalococcoidia bacterium]|jgi:hypothetical protein
MPEQILSESGVVTGYEDDVILDPSTVPEEHRSSICIRRLAGKLDPGTGEPTFDNTGISGTFRSNDDRTDPFIAFITANRNAVEDGSMISHYYDGSGIAIMTTTAKGVADGKPNIFVVDSSLARKDVVLENVLHTGWGDYAYLAAITKEILPNTNYNFTLIFRDSGALEFKIWEAGTGEPATADISYGAHSLLSAGEYWGVSLSESGSYQATWTALHLHNIDPSYSGNYYKMKTAGFPSLFNVVVNGWGDRLNDPGAYGIRLYVKNCITGAWVLQDSHTFGPGEIENCSLRADDLPITVYSDLDSTAHIMVMSTLMSDYASGYDARIIIDEAKLESWSDSRVHVGGYGDAYIHEKTGLEEVYVDLENIDIQEWFNSSNSKITGDLVLPVALIKGIEVLDGSMEPTGVFLDSLTDWTFHVSESALRNSTRENNYFLFTPVGINVRIHYFTFPTILQAQSVTEELARENVVYDLLIKSMTVYETFLDITRVSDNMPYEDRDFLVNWINSEHHAELSHNSIEIALQGNEGVRNATVNQIRVLRHNQDGSVDEIIADESSGWAIALDYEEIEQFLTIDDTVHILFT